MIKLLTDDWSLPSTKLLLMDRTFFLVGSTIRPPVRYRMQLSSRFFDTKTGRRYVCMYASVSFTKEGYSVIGTNIDWTGIGTG